MYQFLKGRDISIGKLYNTIIGYARIRSSSKERGTMLSLYDYIKMEFQCGDEDTDEEIELGENLQIDKDGCCSSINHSAASKVPKQISKISAIDGDESKPRKKLAKCDELRQNCATSSGNDLSKEKHEYRTSTEKIQDVDQTGDKASKARTVTEKQTKLTDYFSKQ